MILKHIPDLEGGSRYPFLCDGFFQQRMICLEFSLGSVLIVHIKKKMCHIPFIDNLVVTDQEFRNKRNFLCGFSMIAFRNWFCLGV